jgi:lysozyme family protein
LEKKLIDNFEHSLDLVLKSEGGYVDNPKDPGGVTNLGVTATTWANWTKHMVTEKIMRSLTKEDVEPLYKRKYWDACNCDDIPVGLDYLVFDFAVNAGPGRSAKLLQRALGLPEDGIIGAQTIQSIDISDKNDLISRFSNVKISYYESLPTFETFGKGWVARVNEARGNASAMIIG